MNKRDRQFFDKHWEEWVKQNPPPPYWGCRGWTLKEYALLEMPCCGFLGRLEFWLLYGN